MKKSLLPLLVLILFVGFSGSLFAQTTIVVSGAGTPPFNGTYYYNRYESGRPCYRMGGTEYDIYWDWTAWYIINWPAWHAYYVNYDNTPTPPATGWAPIYGGLDPAPTLTGYDYGSLAYSSSTFSESNDNYGSIDNSSPMTITLSGGKTFSGADNDDFVSAGKVAVYNLPAGLTVVITRTSSTTVSATITGSAGSHASANNVSNLTFYFQDAAFTTGAAPIVTNYYKSDLQVLFLDNPVNKELKFDGVDDCVQVPYSADLNPYTFTYEFWARVDGGDGSWRAPLASRENNLGLRGVCFYAQNDNTWAVWCGSNGETWKVLNGSAVEDGVWTHLASTYDGTTLRLFINGQFQSQLVTAFTPNGAQPLRFGAINELDDYYFNGTIDEVRIWNVALDPTTIQQNMHRIINPATANLVGYWQFNEGAGTTADDESHTYHGTLHNFAMDAGSGWLASTIPAGAGTSTTVSSFTSGTANLGAVSLTTTNDFDNAVDLTGTAISAAANVLPSGYASLVGDKYFIVNTFGIPGTFSTNLNINFGPGVLDPRADTHPAGVLLYKRSSVSDDVWTLAGGAASANPTTGVVTWNGITSFSQFAAVHDEAGLPVEFISFCASVNSNCVNLQWSTATESDNCGFEVQRKIIGETPDSWNAIGFVVGAGTNTSPHKYSYTDKNLSAGRYAYRVKQIDRDGSFKYLGNAEVEITVPSEFALGANFPNPFNPATTIRYALPTQSRVRMAVYNTLGQIVAELVNGEQAAGWNEVVWNAKVASGLYFYRLEAVSVSGPSKRFVDVKKMVLLK